MTEEQMKSLKLVGMGCGVLFLLLLLCCGGFSLLRVLGS